MVTATLEADRLGALHALNILDTPPEERFDRLTRIASAAFGTPIALVTLVDAERQWFKACIGLDGREDDRAVSFCSIAIETPQPLVIPDTHRDPRVADMRVVTGPPYLRFYAGVPITTATGFRVGTVCIADTRPRELGAAEIALLRDLARIAEDELNHKELADALAAWRESEQRFRAVFDDTAIGMTMVDTGGRIVDANRSFAAMMQIPVGELRGVPINAITHPADREDEMPRSSSAAHGYRREKRFVRPDGTWFWGAVTASMLRDREGRPDVGIGMVEDISERKEIERLKDELVSVVGHELRTPLTSIRGSLGLLEAGVAGELPGEARGHGPDRARERRAADTARRGDARPRTPARGPGGAGGAQRHARRAAREHAQVVQPVADAAGVELTWEAPADLELLVDPDRIVQAVVNLVANAIKFSRAARPYGRWSRRTAPTCSSP